MLRLTIPFVFLLFSCVSSLNAAPVLPGTLPVFDDKKYPTLQDKAEKFVGYLYSIIERENARLLDHRTLISKYRDVLVNNGTLSDNETRILERLASRYKIGDFETLLDALTVLVLRALPVPPSLMLSHALISGRWNAQSESASINLYSIPCSPLECETSTLDNLVDKPFNDINQVIEDYISNVNTNSVFDEFRVKRLKDFKDGLALNGERYISFWEPLLLGSDGVMAAASLISEYDLAQYDSWH
jgi:uncharacterized FlgJ-related protein